MKKLFWLLGAATLAGATPAAAQTCQFAMSGSINNPTAPYDSPLLANFQLACSPVPGPDGGSNYFEIDNVAGLFNGPGVAGGDGQGTGPILLGDVQFYNAAGGGGFGVNYAQSGTYPGFGLFSLEGAQLYSGTLAAPTFTPGTYTFTNDFFYGPATATLVITQLPAIPEPGTWALLILGFGAVGGAMRRRSAAAKVSRTRLTYA